MILVLWCFSKRILTKKRGAKMGVAGEKTGESGNQKTTRPESLIPQGLKAENKTPPGDHKTTGESRLISPGKRPNFQEDHNTTGNTIALPFSFQ
jgi:hypothetical protein